MINIQWFQAYSIYVVPGGATFPVFLICFARNDDARDDVRWNEEKYFLSNFLSL